MKRVIVTVIVWALFIGSLPAGLAAAHTLPGSGFSVFGLIASLDRPFALVDKLSGEGTPLYPEFKEGFRVQKQDDRSQNKYGAARLPEKTVRTAGTGETMNGTPSAAFSRDIPYHCIAPPGFPAVPISGMIVAYLLAFLVLLHRSNLPWEAVLVFVRLSPVTFRRNRDFFI